jgi:ATP-dependent DNA helicase RecG
MRSSHQPYCFVFTSDKDKGTPQRLKALAEAKNGFELAEYDLKFRGAGSLAGIKQWGISDIAMEALKNIKMVEAARVESQRLLKEDSALKNYPLLLERLQNSSNNIHFE